MEQAWVVQRLPAPDWRRVSGGRRVADYCGSANILRVGVEAYSVVWRLGLQPPADRGRGALDDVRTGRRRRLVFMFGNLALNRRTQRQPSAWWLWRSLCCWLLGLRWDARGMVRPVSRGGVLFRARHSGGLFGLIPGMGWICGRFESTVLEPRQRCWCSPAGPWLRPLAAATRRVHDPGFRAG